MSNTIEKQTTVRKYSRSVHGVRGVFLRTADPFCPTTGVFLPLDTFWKMRENVTRFCVDGVVAGPEGVLLGMRNDWPANGKLCPFGGSLLYGDGKTLDSVVVGKVKAETGLVVAINSTPLGVYELIVERANDDTHGKAGSFVHDVIMPFVCHVTGGNLRTSDDKHAGDSSG